MTEHQVEDNVKAARISHQLLIDIMTTGWQPRQGIRCIQGVPPDAEFVKAELEPKTGDALYIFRHPSFPGVLWDEMPLLEVIFVYEAPGGPELIDSGM